MRIGGLASGMDIDTMVQDLMKAERIPLDKLKQKKQVLEWQRDDYRSMNTLLLNFRSELMTMRLSSTYRSRSTTSSDEAKVVATATSAASLASYTISKVDQLATAATRSNQTSSISSTGQKVDLTKSLTDIESQFANQTFNWQTGSVETQTLSATEGGTVYSLTLKDGITVQNNAPMNVKVNGVSYEVVSGGFTDASKNQVMINSSGTMTFNQTIAKGSSIKVDYISSHRIQEVTLSEESNSFYLSSESRHTSSTIQIIKITTGTDSATYTINGTSVLNSNNDVVGSLGTDGKITMNSAIASGAKVEVNYQQKYSSFSIQTQGKDNKIYKENFNISGTDSLNSVINKVNDSTVGVTMFYDSFTDKMTLTRKETGNFNTNGDEILTSGDLINNVLMFGGSTETGGTNAKFTLNGLETERTTNTFDISGVTFSLKQTFSTDTPVGISINNNANQIFENIKGFVTKYNELIAKIQGKVEEERYKTYTPLTDLQREELTDKQQEQWEEKAKSGLLRRDSTLSSLLTKMRSDFANPVQNQGVNPLFNQLATIGIKTTSNYLEGGKLQIDESALKKAIEEDPTSVEKLFNATGNSTSEKGIAQRLTDSVNASLDKLKSKAGNAFSTNKQFEIGKVLDDVNSKINSFEDRLTRVEDRYWRQFTAMEKAIQRSNEQMSQLLNYTG